MGQYDGFCNATNGHPKMDTILSMNGITGIPFNTRVDTLVKYLEFPSNATYEFEFIGGEERADFVEGDILRVIAQNGDTKEYYIKVDIYRPAHNAHLSAITWPDIQDEPFHFLLGGWKQDTLPGFNPSTYYYTLELPSNITQVPVLTCHTQDVNATVEIKPAKYLIGPPADRTYTFIVTAEDDTTVLEYTVLLKSTFLHEQVMPFLTEPLVSQWVYRDYFNSNYIEICNPGEGGVDLSNYMFYNGQANTAEEAITEIPVDYDSRYRKYIPGKKWQSMEKWSITPYMVEDDSTLFPIIGGGVVFVMSRYGSDWPPPDSEVYPALVASDINFSDNPWNDTLNPNDNVACQEPGSNFYMFKILNDSVKNGLKPATDPADFQLIETIGTGNTNTSQFITSIDVNENQSYIRKPEYWQPKAAWGASFGTEETSEWMLSTPEYYADQGYNWPGNMLMLTSNIGSHRFYEVTNYASNVYSRFYKVDDGYVGDLEIRGVVEGETVEDITNKLIKAHEDQTLTFIRAGDGAKLTAEDVVADGDSLIVLSADSANTTKYILDVTVEGLSDDALLKSQIYDISIDDTTGTIAGIQAGTTLREVNARVTLPAESSLYIVHDDGWLVPLQKRAFYTSWVDVRAINQMNFKVIAEDGETSIQYELVLDMDSTDIYLLSDSYDVIPPLQLVTNVPEGTTVSAFLKNIIVPPGATVVIVDKNGLERQFGKLYKDDMVVVTAANERDQEFYYINFLTEPPDYLAYIYPGAYEVDHFQQMIIFCNSIQMTVSEFLSISLLSPGATAFVYDENGNTKVGSEFLEAGDDVKVISSDEKYSRTYTVVITSCVGIDDIISEQFKISPNPTSGSVSIEGLKPESRIQVYNAMGKFMRDQFITTTKEVISLEGEPAGIYFIIISYEEDMVGTYKVMVE